MTNDIIIYITNIITIYNLNINIGTDSDIKINYDYYYNCNNNYYYYVHIHNVKHTCQSLVKIIIFNEYLENNEFVRHTHM